MNGAPSNPFLNAHPGPSSIQPPLIRGWTEHMAPGGQLYWHNAERGMSTYYRPTIPSPPSNNSQPFYTGPPPGFSNETIASRGDIVKKEKPKVKEPIPGTDGWLRVTSNHGNVFYANKITKKSFWSVPEQIREHVRAMEMNYKVKGSQKIQQQEKESKTNGERNQINAQERSNEGQGNRNVTEQDVNKRKRDFDGPNEGEKTSDKRKRAMQHSVEDETEDDDDDWQYQIAAEMAAEAGEGKESLQVSEKSLDNKVSIEEGKDRFMKMLSQLNGTADEINPMAPWDKELPKFNHLEEYTILEELSDRQDTFNEWCRIRIREKREAKAKKVESTSNKTGEGGSVAQSSQTKVPTDHLMAYKTLLEGEVKSTRMHWEDFRRNWKKDRRFFSFGRDDREREKVFREWLKELGEKKRKAAQRSENDFLHLLDEYLSHSNENRMDSEASREEVQRLWSSCKRTKGLDRDPRYEAVGSSTRRAELFEEWSKGNRKADQMSKADEEKTNTPKSSHRDTLSAIRQREEEVSRKRRLIQGEKTRTLGKALYEEELTNFQQLLIDAIRDPLVSIEDSFRDLSKDQRFNTQSLSSREKENLFFDHIDRLEQRRLRSLESIFERHAPTLEVERDIALPLILDDDEVERKQLSQIRSVTSGRKSIATLFDDWHSRKEEEARRAFEQMLRENAFLDFWGRLQQEYKQKAEKGEKTNDELGNQVTTEDDDEINDAPDLLQMSATIKLDEIHAVLRDDQRYRAFQHEPDLRERWIRDFLQQMEISKKSVFQR